MINHDRLAELLLRAQKKDTYDSLAERISHTAANEQRDIGTYAATFKTTQSTPQSGSPVLHYSYGL